MQYVSLLIAIAGIIYWQTTPRSRVRRMYIRAKQESVSAYSDWFDPLVGFFPMPKVYGAYRSFIDEVRNAIKIRQGDTTRVYEVAAHLLRFNYFDAATCNSWYALMRAKKGGAFDEQLMPIYSLDDIRS